MKSNLRDRWQDYIIMTFGIIWDHLDHLRNDLNDSWQNTVEEPFPVKQGPENKSKTDL